MVGDSAEKRELLGQGRGITVLLGLAWVWLGLAILLSFLGYLATDGCTDAACESDIARGWWPLMGVQAVVLGAAFLLAGRRRDRRIQLGLMAALAAISSAAFVVFLRYIDALD